MKTKATRKNNERTKQEKNSRIRWSLEDGVTPFPWSLLLFLKLLLTFFPLFLASKNVDPPASKCYVLLLTLLHSCFNA